MLLYKKRKSAIHFHVIPVMKCGCVFWESQKGSWQHENIREDKDNKELAARVVSLS
jgi:hypothetical protein